MTRLPVSIRSLSREEYADLEDRGFPECPCPGESMGIRGFQPPDGSDQPMGASGGFHVYLVREGSYTSLHGRASGHGLSLLEGARPGR